MKRLLALLGALLMILVAVLVRGVIDGKTPGRAARGGDGPPRILCATELKAVCEKAAEGVDITLSYADPGTTVDAIVKGEVVDFDAWLLVGPWDRVLADNLRFAQQPAPANPLVGSATVLARSPVVFATMNPQAGEKVAAVCPTGPAVACAVDDPALKIGMAPPRRGDGLVTLAEVVAGRLGSDDFTADDLEDPATASFIGNLADTSRKAGLGNSDPFTVAVTKKGQFQAVATLEAHTSRRPEGVQVSYPTPLMSATAALAFRSDASPGEHPRAVPDQVVSALRDALAAAGWRTGTGPPPFAPDAPGLPAGNGLPAAGVLQVLRDVWGTGG